MMQGLKSVVGLKVYGLGIRLMIIGFRLVESKVQTELATETLFTLMNALGGTDERKPV